MSKTIAESELDLNKVFDEFFEKYKDSKSVEVYEEQLEGWFKIIDELREENKNLKEENEYLQNRVKGAENMIELLKEDKRSYEDKLTELMEFIEKNFGIE